MTSSDQFVRTAEIRLAVEGREEDVLDALGIPFRTARGKGHIDCPYPDHGGANDWRWDDQKRRARCTCLTSAGILDVVMKCEAVDLEGAKLRVAEMIGRSDLIRTRGGGEKDVDNRFLKTTPEGLMGVKADFRDDALVANYLAFRLGIDDVDVLLPSTPVRGITHNAIWDPPKTRNGKLKLFGIFPAVAFLAIDCDRRKHAHRIFVAPNGRGKADLGSLDGRPRPVKKAAKVTEGDNTAGRSVFWGDPAVASHLIVAEGIETAAAIAHALRSEVEAKSISVAAAISAVGVEAFRPWPATKMITVAADRDDAEKRGKPGSQRGEQAARKLGMRLLKAVAVKVALPGEPGQSTDWLDTLLETDIATVRRGVLEQADDFRPTKNELEEWRQSADREAEIAEAQQVYPLPQMQARTLYYAHDAKDRVMVHEVKVRTFPGGKPSEEIVLPVMTPVGVTARLRHADQGDGYSLRIVVQDMNGRPRELDVARSALAKMSGAEIKSMLFENGLRTEGDGEAVAVAILKAADPEHEITLVARPSWHSLEPGEEPFFVVPSGSVVGNTSGRSVELGTTSRLPAAIAKGGSLKGWKDAVAAALAQMECPHWTLGVMAGFAGPLIALTGLDTCGINLSGRSSSGKSTAQKLAVSAWTVPDTTKNGFFRSAKATANGIETFSHQANGTILSIDEMAHVSGKEVAKMIYMIAGGVGKQRMKADASAREAFRWQTFTIMSAECSLQEKVESDGETFMAGMAVRIPDVDVSGINRDVDRGTMGRIEEVQRHYGHAGPAFVEFLIGEGLHLKADELRAAVGTTAIAIAGGEGADSALIRAAMPFAILVTAGRLAQRAALLPGDVDLSRAVSWAWSRFQSSSDAKVLDPSAQAIANLRLWILERWGVTIRDVENNVGNQIAVGWYDADAVYIPKDRLRDAAGGALKQQEIVAALEAEDFIARRKGTRPYVTYVPKIGDVGAYALKRSAFGRSNSQRDLSAYPVIQGGRDRD